jgi:hypothetical protein
MCLGRLPTQGSTRCSGCFHIDSMATALTYLRCQVEVCTINPRSSGQWRRKQRPTEPFVWDERTRVVIGEVVYFTVDAYLSALLYQGTQQRRDPTSEKIWIVSFNLEAEEWGLSIKGPSSLVDDKRLCGDHGRPSKQLTLANLNGSLVIVCWVTPYMDLWFLMDSDKGLWIKNYSVQIEHRLSLPAHPLTLLDDGMIVIKCLEDLLQIHDSSSNTFSNLLKLSSFIFLYDHCVTLSLTAVLLLPSLSEQLWALLSSSLSSSLSLFAHAPVL